MSKLASCLSHQIILISFLTQIRNGEEIHITYVHSPTCSLDSHASALFVGLVNGSVEAAGISQGFSRGGRSFDCGVGHCITFSIIIIIIIALNLGIKKSQQ